MKRLPVIYIKNGYVGWFAVVGTDDRRASADGPTPRSAVRRARLAWWRDALRDLRDARQVRRMGLDGVVRK